MGEGERNEKDEGGRSGNGMGRRKERWRKEGGEGTREDGVGEGGERRKDEGAGGGSKR